MVFPVTSLGRVGAKSDGVHHTTLHCTDVVSRGWTRWGGTSQVDHFLRMPQGILPWVESGPTCTFLVQSRG